MSKTRTVYHPTLDLTQEVTDDQVEAWRESGWLLKKPRRTTTTSAAPAADQGQHPDEGDH